MTLKFNLKLSILSVLVSLFYAIGLSQNLKLIQPLSTQVGESSGLITLEGRLITHNDSGGPPILYELDTLDGQIIREVFIKGAGNKDWEDICLDDKYIYIADFGNNQGNRTDLGINRIRIDDYIQLDTVMAEKISFQYEDQVDFSNQEFATNFDAEAIVSIGDSLYVFTKNWADNQSNIYSLSKDPGIYTSKKRGQINTDGFVTGASYNKEEQTLVLVGYTLITPFTIRISNFNLQILDDLEVERFNLQMPSGFSYQMEAVTFKNKDSYYVSSESSFIGDGGLFNLTFDRVLSLNRIQGKELQVFPNPCYEQLNIMDLDVSKVELFDMKGKLAGRWHKPTVDVSSLEAGYYIIKVWDRNNMPLVSKQVLIR